MKVHSVDYSSDISVSGRKYFDSDSEQKTFSTWEHPEPWYKLNITDSTQRWALTSSFWYVIKGHHSTFFPQPSTLLNVSLLHCAGDECGDEEEDGGSFTSLESVTRVHWWTLRVSTRAGVISPAKIGFLLSVWCRKLRVSSTLRSLPKWSWYAVREKSTLSL